MMHQWVARWEKPSGRLRGPAMARQSDQASVLLWGKLRAQGLDFQLGLPSGL